MKSCLVLSVFFVATALCLAALAFLLIQASPATEARRQADLAYQRQRDAQDLAERAQRAELNARLMDAWIPAAQVTGAGVIIVVPIAAGLAGYAWLRRRHRDHSDIVLLDGATPLPRQRLLTGFYDELLHGDVMGRRAADVERARNPVHQLPPMLRTYSPRYGNQAAPRIVGSDPNAQALAAPPEPVRTPAPTFGELLQRGLVGPGRFALGWDPGRGMPAFGTFGDLYSVAVLGATGSGKSTSARALVSQTAMNGGKLIVIDPHLHAGRDSLAGDLAPLSNAFLLAPVDDDPAAVKHALAAVLQLMSERKAGATGPTVLVVIDEWTSLVSRGGPRAEMLTRTMRLLAVEGRKLGLHGCVIMQDATKEAVGPLRDVLASSYVHRSRPQHARMVAPGLKADTWSLAPGEVWLDQVSAPPRLLTMPECTPSDVAAVGRLLLPTPTGPRNDSASWAAPTPRPATPVQQPPVQPPPVQQPITPPAPARPDLRIIRPDDGVGSHPSTPPTPVDRDETAREPEPPTPPTPPTPVTLSARAAAAGIPLDEEESRLVEAMDAGKSSAGAAAALAGQHKGGRYERLKRKAEDLQRLIENWPAGQRWEG